MQMYIPSIKSIKEKMGILRINPTAMRNQLEIMIQTEHLRRINNGLSCFNVLVPALSIDKIADNQYIVRDRQYGDRIILDITMYLKNAAVTYYYEQNVFDQPIQLSSKYLLLVSPESKKALDDFIVQSL